MPCVLPEKMHHVVLIAIELIQSTKTRNIVNEIIIIFMYVLIRVPLPWSSSKIV